MSGKGDKLRPGADLEAYRDNYDNIFRKQTNETTTNEESKHKSQESAETEKRETDNSE